MNKTINNSSFIKYQNQDTLFNIKRYSQTNCQQYFCNTDKIIKEKINNGCKAFFIKIINKIAQFFWNAKSITEQNAEICINFAINKIHLLYQINENFSLTIPDAIVLKKHLYIMKDYIFNIELKQKIFFLNQQLNDVIFTQLKKDLIIMMDEASPEFMQECLINFDKYPLFAYNGSFPFRDENNQIITDAGMGQSIYLDNDIDERQINTYIPKNINLSNEQTQALEYFKYNNNLLNLSQEKLINKFNERQKDILYNYLKSNKFNINQKKLFHLSHSIMWGFISKIKRNIELQEYLINTDNLLDRICDKIRLGADFKHLCVKLAYKILKKDNIKINYYDRLEVMDFYNKYIK